MDLRSICLYLYQKGMNAIEIHNHIESTFGPDAISYFTVTKYRRETQVTHDSELSPISIEDECQRLIDKALLLALAEELFASVRRLASKTLISRTTVYRHADRPFGMTVKHLRWVAHSLSPQQKGNRVQRA
jgi:transcriptional antiterminator